MADYYPVLKRAISSLPSSSGEARRAVYERARSALLKQLQSYDPPLPPNEVTDQRLALEECIRRVESETAGAAFGLTPDAPKAPEVRVEPPVARPAPTVATPPVAAPVAPQVVPEPPMARAEPEAPPAPEPRREAPQPELKADAPINPLLQALGAKPQAKSAPVFESRVAAPKADNRPDLRIEPRLPGSSAPASPAPSPDEPRPDIAIEAGRAALSRTLKSAEPLGQAASQATRLARESIERPEPVRSAPPRIEPAFAPASDQAPAQPEFPEPLAPLRAPRGPLLTPFRAIMAVVLLLLIGAGSYAYVQRETITAFLVGNGADRPATASTPGTPATATETGLEPKIIDRLPQDGATATPVADDALAVTTERVPGSDLEPGIPPPPGGASTTVADAQPLTPETPPAEPLAETPETPVVTDPAELPTAPATPTTPETPPIIVAQRAILYEEPVPGSQGARVDGQVLWSFVNEPVLPGEPPVPQARATVEIPARGIKMVVNFRKNNDPAFPASHITELRFELGPEFGATIDTTPGLIMKQTEDARGDPLIGAVAKVADNLFWVALSGTDTDRTRNLALMQEREWIDVPIRYSNRRRAILTFEKGTPGSNAFSQAFAAWQ